MLMFAIVLALQLPPEDQPSFDAMWQTVTAAYDTTRGGYVTKDGAPVEAAIELSLHLGRDDAAARERAIRTIEWTLGLFDSVGGGFLSRARDADPLKASFEKMTVPNARRLEVLTDAWNVTGNPRYQRFAAQTVDYFDRVLLDGRGGFVHGQVGERALIPESNGIGIRAWMEWAGQTGSTKQRNFGWKSLDRSWEESWMGSPGMIRRGTFGEITEAPRLADQVEMGRAYLMAAHLAGREVDLQRALEIADTMLVSYGDPKGGFRTRAMPNKKGVIKNAKREFVENARAARFLAELATISGQSRFRDVARATLASFDAKAYEKADVEEAAEVALAIRALHVPDLPARPEWKVAVVEKAQPEDRSASFKLRRRR